MGRNWIAMLLLGGVAIFFMGCEKEALKEVGEPVLVHFSLSGEDYGGSEVRGMAGRGVSETVIVPLNEDFCIYARLSEDTEAQLRDFETIPTNTLVMIVAYNGSGYVDHREYKVDNTNGDIVPVVAPGMSVPSNDTYTFVAYSINSTGSVPAYVDPLPSTPEEDLLWGSEPNTYVGPGGVSLTIGMRHKFSKVTVVADLTSVPNTITLGTPSGVTIAPGYDASLNVQTGVMTKTGASVAKPIPSPWTGTSPTLTATPRLVYTNGERPVSVTIGSVTVGSVTYTGKVAKFDIPFVEGHEYVLTLDLKRTVVFAGSNIYWDSLGQKLTFDAPTTDVSASSPQRKQGVLFKWGSLVGISPAAQGVVETFIDNSGSYNNLGYGDYGTNTTLYVSSNGYTWTSSAHFDWDDIPVVDWPYGESRNLSDDAYNTASLWENEKGDICRYISEKGFGPGGATNKYRMPILAEMGEKSSYSYGSDGWSKTPTGSWPGYYYGSNGTSNGTTLMSSYATNSYANVIFPASGFRQDFGAYDSAIKYPGVIQNVNFEASYFTSDCKTLQQAFGIVYNMVARRYPEETGVVRCVRAN